VSPLVRIGFGLMIMLLHAPYLPKGAPKWETYDIFADPLGWVFVIWALVTLRRIDEIFQPALWASGVALVTAVVTWFPQITHQLDPSAKWVTSLPQVVAIALICRGIAYLARDQKPPVLNIAQRQTVLMWGQVALGVLPPILISIDNNQLLIGMFTFAGLLMVVTTVSMFLDQRHTWLGGPGPRPLPEFKKPAS
jgi:hypothetical protein